MTLARDLPPDEVHVRDICRPGAGAACCRYLTMSAKGWSCEKHSFLRYRLDAMASAMTAKGNNCEGRGSR